MTWLLRNWKLVVGCGLLIACFVAGFSASSYIDAAEAAKVKLEADAAELAAREKDANTIGDLQYEKSLHLAVIDSLHTTVVGLRLPAACGASADTGGSLHGLTGARPLQSDASATIAGYSEEVDRQFGYADKIIEQCRVDAEYLKSLRQ